MCSWTHAGFVRGGDLMMGLQVIKDPNLNENYGNQLFIGHIYLSGMLLGVAPRMDIVKACI